MFLISILYCNIISAIEIRVDTTQTYLNAPIKVEYILSKDFSTKSDPIQIIKFPEFKDFHKRYFAPMDDQTLLSFYLFPQKKGKIILDSLEANIKSELFSSNVESVEVLSLPINSSIQSKQITLVGSYTFSSSPKKSMKVRGNTPLELELKIKGFGALEQFYPRLEYNHPHLEYNQVKTKTINKNDGSVEKSWIFSVSSKFPLLLEKYENVFITFNPKTKKYEKYIWATPSLHFDHKIHLFREELPFYSKLMYKKYISYIFFILSFLQMLYWIYIRKVTAPSRWIWQLYKNTLNPKRQNFSHWQRLLFLLRTNNDGINMPDKFNQEINIQLEHCAMKEYSKDGIVFSKKSKNVSFKLKRYLLKMLKKKMSKI